MNFNINSSCTDSRRMRPGFFNDNPFFQLYAYIFLISISLISLIMPYLNWKGNLQTYIIIGNGYIFFIIAVPCFPFIMKNKTNQKKDITYWKCKQCNTENTSEHLKCWNCGKAPTALKKERKKSLSINKEKLLAATFIIPIIIVIIMTFLIIFKALSIDVSTYLIKLKKLAMIFAEQLKILLAKEI